MGFHYILNPPRIGLFEGGRFTHVLLYLILEQRRTKVSTVFTVSIMLLQVSNFVYFTRLYTCSKILHVTDCELINNFIHSRF